MTGARSSAHRQSIHPSLLMFCSATNPGCALLPSRSARSSSASVNSGRNTSAAKTGLHRLLERVGISLRIVLADFVVVGHRMGREEHEPEVAWMYSIAEVGVP
jgi:hypothetical protein